MHVLMLKLHETMFGLTFHFQKKKSQKTSTVFYAFFILSVKSCTISHAFSKKVIFKRKKNDKQAHFSLSNLKVCAFAGSFVSPLMLHPY